MTAQEIEVIQSGARWVAKATYEQRHIVKEAGFRWDPGSKCWYTKDADVAASLSDPIARQRYAEKRAAEQAAAAQAIEASRAASADVDIEIPAPEGLVYLPYQRAGIVTGLGRTNVLFGDEMGLGKTIQAIGILNADPSLMRILVMCPASLRLNWRNELRKWLVRELRIVVAEGSSCRTDWGDILICNYDIADRHSEKLRAVAWDALILDEAHYLKNPKAKRTIAVLGAPGKRKGDLPVPGIAARRRIALTGTPIPNRPVEGWPLFNALGAFGEPGNGNFFAYAKRYCAAYQGAHGWDFTGASNLEELQNKLRASIMIRRLKMDVLTELPPKRRSIIELPANGAAGVVAAEAEAAAQHEELLDNLRAAAELAKASDDPAEYEAAVDKLKKAAQVAFTELSQRRHDTAVAKVPYVVEHLREIIASGRKVICFAHHKDVVSAIMAEFPNFAVKVTGDDDMYARQRAVEAFQNDPGTLLFVGNIMAAGVGLTLTAASHVVFAELDWVPGNVTQAEDRAHRIGQRDTVLVEHLVLEGSLDSRMVRVLVAKQRIIEQALDKVTEAAAPPEAAEQQELLDLAPSRDTEPAATSNTSRRQIEREAAELALAPAQVEAIHRGLQMLAGMDLDRARDLNGKGFSRIDVQIGHDLASRAWLTPRQAALGGKLVRKYRRQLPAELVSAAAAE